MCHACAMLRHARSPQTAAKFQTILVHDSRDGVYAMWGRLVMQVMTAHTVTRQPRDLREGLDASVDDGSQSTDI